MRHCGDYDAQHVRSTQPCTADELDPRFATYSQHEGWHPPFGHEQGHANDSSPAACWPAACPHVRDEEAGSAPDSAP